MQEISAQPRRKLGLPLGLLFVLLFALVPAAPVFAQTNGGTGRFAGTEEEHQLAEEPTSGGEVCLEVLEATMTFKGVGTYHGVDRQGASAVYRAQIEGDQELHAGGPLELFIDSEEHFIAPEGTYLERRPGSPECDRETFGEDGKIPATFTMYAAEHVHHNDEPCTAEGHWWRVQSTFFAEWTLTEDCAIEGNEPGLLGGGVAPAGTEHSIEGNFDPCFEWDWPCEDNITGSFEQRLPAGETAADRDARGAPRPARSVGPDTTGLVSASPRSEPYMAQVTALALVVALLSRPVIAQVIRSRDRRQGRDARA